jgi:hypothetical protein
VDPGGGEDALFVCEGGEVFFALELGLAGLDGEFVFVCVGGVFGGGGGAVACV